jgi:hypothetical protein
MPPDSLPNLNQLIPANFREALGASSVTLAVVLLFISLIRTQRDHALRGAGLLLVFGIVLFANNGWTYFAGAFIAATAVTQLEFLQNLAAILRGASKEYFKYHREFIPPREIEEKVAQDVTAGEAVGAEDFSNPQDQAAAAPGDADSPQVTFAPERRMTAGQFGILVEEFAFRFLERKYG